jgi:hypothetical protein
MAAHTGIAGIRGDTAAEPASATPKWAALAWALLIINTLGSTGAKTVIPLPRSVSQLVTMGALMTAFVIALVLNKHLRIRPSAYLLLLTLLLVSSILSSADLQEGAGALFRCFRLTVFVSTLWLLTRWWDGGSRSSGPTSARTPSCSRRWPSASWSRPATRCRRSTAAGFRARSGR